MAFDVANFNLVFGTLTTSIKTELTIQWEEKRILGNEYAAAYTQLMDTALKLSFSDQAQQVQSTVAKEQSAADKLLKEAQTKVYDRQRKGFNDNIKQKLFEAQLNAWGLMFSSGMLETAPAFTGDSSLTTLYNGIIADLATNV